MKASTREWVVKADEDFLAASALNRRRSKPLWNVVAFHVQQTVEKYLKARLEEAGLSIPKTHDLLHLLNLVTPILLPIINREPPPAAPLVMLPQLPENN